MNLFFVLFSTFAATASANCNPNGQPNNGQCQCEEYGGQCSKAADIFLNQIGNFNSKAPQNVLSYGRYCGASTKCPGNGKDVDACDVNFLDDACKVHDTCLGDLDKSKGFEGRTPEQCACDATLLGTLLFAASTPGVAPIDELCDEDFYNDPVITIAPSFNRTPGMGGSSRPLFNRPTSSHCTSVGNQPQIKSGGVLESSALALHDCTTSQIPISHPCARVPLKK